MQMKHGRIFLMKRFLCYLFGSLLWVASASSQDIKSAGIRLIPVQTPKGTFKVWTKKVGSGNIKLLLLHGGPGATHEYFECFEDFLPKEGVEFYYYDQLGSYYSDQPKDSSLWRIDR